MLIPSLSSYQPLPRTVATQASLPQLYDGPIDNDSWFGFFSVHSVLGTGTFCISLFVLRTNAHFIRGRPPRKHVRPTTKVLLMAGHLFIRDQSLVQAFRSPADSFCYTFPKKSRIAFMKSLAHLRLTPSRRVCYAVTSSFNQHCSQARSWAWR